MKLSEEDRATLLTAEDLSVFISVQKALEIIDAQHTALRAVRHRADASRDPKHGPGGCGIYAAELFADLNGLGSDDE